MSKIAEKIHDTALKKGEEYSKSHGGSVIEEVAYGRGYKTAYIECYDQAMQDFMEKAKKWIEYEWSNSSVANLMFNSFKNYMRKNYDR